MFKKINDNEPDKKLSKMPVRSRVRKNRNKSCHKKTIPNQEMQLFKLENPYFGVTPSNRSLVRSELNNCDMALFKGRSFKVGWVHGFMFTAITKPEQCFVPRIHRNIFFMEFEHINTNCDGFSHTLPEHMLEVLYNSEVSIENGVPLFKMSYGKNMIENHKRIADIKGNAQEKYYRNIWRLLSVFWGKGQSQQISGNLEKEACASQNVNRSKFGKVIGNSSQDVPGSHSQEIVGNHSQGVIGNNSQGVTENQSQRVIGIDSEINNFQEVTRSQSQEVIGNHYQEIRTIQPQEGKGNQSIQVARNQKLNRSQNIKINHSPHPKDCPHDVKARFSSWLQDVVEDNVYECLESDAWDKEKSMKNINVYLSGHKIKEAAETAMKVDMPQTSLSIAAANSTCKAREAAKRQIFDWEKSKAIDFIDRDVLKIHLILAGILKLRNVNVCESLDRLRSFGMFLWYISPSSKAISHSVKLYEEAFKKTLATPPLPPYRTESYSHNCGYNTENSVYTEYCDTFDLFYMIILLHVDKKFPLERILKPLTHTQDSTDYRLSWLLLQIFTALGLGTIREDTRNYVHVSFASQLESMDMFKWAVFVLLFLKDPILKKTLVMDILYRNLRCDDDETQKIEFDLVWKFRVPVEWIEEVKANRCLMSKRYWECYSHLKFSNKWNDCHNIAIKHLIPTLLISSQYTEIYGILNPLIPYSSLIPSWNTEGGLVVDFLNLYRSFQIYEQEKICDKEKICQQEKIYGQEKMNQQEQIFDQEKINRQEKINQQENIYEQRKTYKPETNCKQDKTEYNQKCEKLEKFDFLRVEECLNNLISRLSRFPTDTEILSLCISKISKCTLKMTRKLIQLKSPNMLQLQGYHLEDLVMPYDFKIAEIIDVFDSYAKEKCKPPDLGIPNLENCQ